MDKKWQHYSAFRVKVFSTEYFSISFNKNQLAKRRRIKMQVEINTLSKFFSINCKLSKNLAITFSHSGRDFYL